MPEKIGVITTRLLQSRDELSFGNIRKAFWPILLIFPFSVIMENSRYFTHSVALAGYETDFLMFFILGLGWLIAALIPKKLIIPFLRLAAVFSAVIIPFLAFIPMGFGHFTVYMIFKFLNGLCTACAFFLFCFVLNNIERLLGMAIIQIYYGFFYITWTTFPLIHMAGYTYGNIVIMVLYLIVVFSIRTKQGAKLSLAKLPLETNTDSNGKGSGVPFVIGLGIIHYMIMCLSSYIEWTENAVSSFAFGLGIFISIGLIIILQLFNSRNAMYIWFLFLALSLLGLGALLYDNSLTFITGSFAYGLGDSLGYIIIYYICAGAIKQSRSLRMFKLYCLVLFGEYFIISGFFSIFFNYFEAPNKFLAFGVVLFLVTLCLLFMPLIQKRLFEADWTDGLFLKDMEKYSQPIAQTKEINIRDKLNLTPREEEIFTMLLSGAAPKEIAHTLKISYHTEHYHQKNLYRKLGIQSISELFARYSRSL